MVTELRRLLTWLSPAFPVGAFSYSHGLEWAVEAGDVKDHASLVDWLDALLRHGAGRSDAVLLAEAWRAAKEGDAGHLRELAVFAAALAPGRERHLETTAQGNAFVAALRVAWPTPFLDEIQGPVPYPVAVGAATATHGIELCQALDAYLHAFVANLVSAGVRLIPLGQSDGLRAIAALDGSVAGIAEAAAAEPLCRIGSFAPRNDIASFRHETQHTRLFRS
jgi:urease accessory protein